MEQTCVTHGPCPGAWLLNETPSCWMQSHYLPCHFRVICSAVLFWKQQILCACLLTRAHEIFPLNYAPCLMTLCWPSDTCLLSRGIRGDGSAGKQPWERMRTRDQVLRTQGNDWRIWRLPAIPTLGRCRPRTPGAGWLARLARLLSPPHPGNSERQRDPASVCKMVS